MSGLLLLSVAMLAVPSVENSLRRQSHNCVVGGMFDDLSIGVEQTDYWNYSVQQQGIEFNNNREDVALYNQIHGSSDKMTGVTFDVYLTNGYLEHRFYSSATLILTIRISESMVSVKNILGTFERNRIRSSSGWTTISYQLVADPTQSDIQSGVSNWNIILFMNGIAEVLKTDVASHIFNRITSTEVIGVGADIVLRNRWFSCLEIYPIYITSIDDSGTLLKMETFWTLPRTFPTTTLSIYLSKDKYCFCTTEYRCDYPSEVVLKVTDQYTSGKLSFTTEYSGATYYICAEGFSIGNSHERRDVVDRTVPSNDVCPTVATGLVVESTGTQITLSAKNLFSCFKQDLLFYGQFKIIKQQTCPAQELDVKSIICFAQCEAAAGMFSDCTGPIHHGHTCNKILSETVEGCPRDFICQNGVFQVTSPCQISTIASEWNSESRGAALSNIGGHTYSITPQSSYSCVQSIRTKSGYMRVSSHIAIMETTALSIDGNWVWSIEFNCKQGCLAPKVTGAHPLQTVTGNGQSLYWAAMEGFYCAHLTSTCSVNGLDVTPSCLRTCFIPTELHIILRCPKTVPVVGTSCIWEPDSLSSCDIDSAIVICTENGFTARPAFTCIHKNLISAATSVSAPQYKDGFFRYSISIDGDEDLIADGVITPFGTLSTSWLRDRIVTVLSGEYIACKVLVTDVCPSSTVCIPVNGAPSFSSSRKVSTLSTSGSVVFSIFPATTSTVRATDITHILTLVLTINDVVSVSPSGTFRFTSGLSLSQDTTLSLTPYPQYSSGGTLYYSGVVLSFVLIFLVFM